MINVITRSCVVQFSFYKVEIIPYISENVDSDLPFSKCIQVNFLVLLPNLISLPK